METFIAEFALICCSQLKLCQSKVFNIKYDEFPQALILQNHPAQGDSCQVEHKSSGLGSASQCRELELHSHHTEHSHSQIYEIQATSFPAVSIIPGLLLNVFFLDNTFPPI